MFGGRMDSFEFGHHIVAEVADEDGVVRKIGGYLMDTTGEGIILKVTHKECSITRVISEETRANFLGQLESRGMGRLRMAALYYGRPGWLRLPREALIGALLTAVEKEFLESRDDGVKLREMTEPVLTFVNFGILRMMESTEDKIVDADASLFDQTLDDTLKKILDVGLTEDEPTVTEETKEPNDKS